MHESEYDSEYWLNFLQEFDQPLDDDPENDPDFTTNKLKDCESVTLFTESIGQRTRSKFPLTDTPLEVIEQAFVPPDITTDMYDTECNNKDWLDFLKELVQPTDNKNTEHNDADDDPDFTMNMFKDCESLEDSIGQRTRSKLPLTDTPLEVIEQAFVPPDITIDDKHTKHTDADDDPDCTTNMSKNCESVNSSEDSIGRRTRSKLSLTDTPMEVIEHAFVPPDIEIVYVEKHTDVDRDPAYDQDNTVSMSKEECESVNSLTQLGNEVSNSTRNNAVLSTSQILLLEQQMRQHVQLCAIHFLQCYKHPSFCRLADKFKSILVNLQRFAGDNRNSKFRSINLNSALSLMNKWEELNVDVPEPKTNFFKRRRRADKNRTFSATLMKVVSSSDVCLYPLLLPKKPFVCDTERNLYRKELTSSEEWLLAFGLALHNSVGTTIETSDASSIKQETLISIINDLLPYFRPHFLRRYIEKKRSENKENVIKFYFEKRKVPQLWHYIIPVSPKPLFEQPSQLLPDIWKTYIKNNYFHCAFEQIS